MTEGTLIDALRTQSVPLYSTPSRRSALKPLVLTSYRKECCGAPLTMRYRPSSPVVYTTQGASIAAAFHAYCQHCHFTYYANSCANDEMEYYHTIGDVEYFQISSQTVFHVSFLKEVTNLLALCSTTFEAIANSYNATHGSTDNMQLKCFEEYARTPKADYKWELNPQRLEEGWFLYKLVEFFSHHGEPSKNYYTTPISGRRNIEKLCQDACHDLFVGRPSWIDYRCTVKGCAEGYATVDGNQKVCRSMCCAPKAAVKLDKGKFSLMSCCPNTPIGGGKHQLPSKYCSVHMNLEVGTESDSVDLGSDIQNEAFVQAATSEMAELLPLLEDCTAAGESNESCKPGKKRDSFFDRTAGILALVRLCGIIVNWSEMYTAESASQVFFFLINTFGRGKDISSLRYLGYDRGCSLHPYLVNLAKHKASFAQYFLRHVKFLVDRFHIEKHVSATCMPLGNPECKYHPDLEEFKEIKECNTQCAEQAFKWINKLRSGTRNMSRFKFNFYLHTMIEIHNAQREQQLQQRKK